MCASAQADVVTSKGAELCVAQAGLHGDKKQRVVAAAYPGAAVGRRDERCRLLFGQELDHRALVALVRDCEDLLALQGARRLCVRKEPEEAAHCGEAGVASPRHAAALALKVIEEGDEEWRVRSSRRSLEGCRARRSAAKTSNNRNVSRYDVMVCTLARRCAMRRSVKNASSRTGKLLEHFIADLLCWPPAEPEPGPSVRESLSGTSRCYGYLRDPSTSTGLECLDR